MAEPEVKDKKKNGGNGNGSQVDKKVVEDYLKNKNKADVPHPFNVLFNQEEEKELDKTTRVNNREVVFFGVNATRDDALVPPRTKLHPEGRPSISTCLRLHLKSLKISLNGDGRTDVKDVNQITQEEAMEQNANSANF
jgi:hypothetical protein